MPWCGLPSANHRLNQMGIAISCLHAFHRSHSPRCEEGSFHARRSFSWSCLICFFFHDVLFHPLRLLYIFSSFVKIEYIFGRRQTHSAVGTPAHSSFILPKTFFVNAAIKWVLLRVITRVGVVQLFFVPCPCICPPFGLSAAGCLCPCKLDYTWGRTASSRRCSKSRTSGSCCCQGSSFPCGVQHQLAFVHLILPRSFENNTCL